MNDFEYPYPGVRLDDDGWCVVDGEDNGGLVAAFQDAVGVMRGFPVLIRHRVGADGQGIISSGLISSSDSRGVNFDFGDNGGSVDYANMRAYKIVGRL